MTLEFRAKTEPRERRAVMEIKVRKVWLVRMEQTGSEVPKVTPALLDLLVVMDAWGKLDHLAPPAPLVPWWRVRRCRDLQVPMVLTEPRECLETLDLRERWAPEETRDLEELLERMGCRVHLVLKARKEEWEMWVSLGSKVRRETEARVVSWDPQEYRELQDCPASLASREYQDCLETQGRLEGRETQDLQGWMGRTGWTASLE